MFYAVNGVGAGHVTRLLAVARWMRRYAALLGVQLDAVFLTTSEADRLAFDAGFPSFKLPSKTLVKACGMDPLAYRALAKQWVWHTLALLRPEIFVVDTFPRGSFGELGPALDLVTSKAFVYRATQREVAAQPDFQATLPLYDLIVVPREPGDAPLVPEGARDRVLEVGPIVSVERFELTPRDLARDALGLPRDGRAALVTAGGGSDRSVDLAAVARELVARGHHVVIGAGPLHRGPAVVAPGVVFSREPGLGAHLLAFDGALAAAGYNTFHELALAGVPAVLVPQPRLADDQAARARSGPPGLFVVAPDGATPAELAGLVAALPSPRPTATRSHARDVAAELLRLALSPAEVDRAAATLDDEALAARPAGDERDWISLLAQVARGRALDPSIVARAAGLAGASLADTAALAKALLWRRGGGPRERLSWLEASLPHARALGCVDDVVRLIHRVAGQRGAAAVPAALAEWAARGASAREALAE